MSGVFFVIFFAGNSYFYRQFRSHMYKHLTPFFIFLFCSLLTFAQIVQPDSLSIPKDSSKVNFFYHNIGRTSSLRLHALDTAINGFQNYDLLTKYNSFYATLGNIGSAYNNLMPYPFWQPSGFDYGIHTFDNYLYQNDSVKYYRVMKTYTELEYVQGAHKELNFIARFSRNIWKSLNLGFDFHVSNSPGAYRRQNTNLINFVLTAQFFSKTKRYGVIANFLVNRIKNEENGGIRYDSLFEQNIESNRQIIPVSLEKAQNRVKESGFYMKHFFNLTHQDPQRPDSLIKRGKRVDFGRILYAFQYNRKIFNFLDGDIDTVFFRNNHLIDTLDTRDSITVKKIVNEISWTNPSHNPKKRYRILQLEGKLKYQYIEVTNHSLKRYFNQYIPSGWVSFRPFKTLKVEAYLDYVFGDYNEGDISGMVSISQVLGKQGKNAGTISLLGHYKYQKPGWFYEHYLGNNFVWDTVWHRQGLISGSAIYHYKFLTLGGSMARLTNYVYLDSMAMPAQERDEIGYICAWLNTDINLWRFKFNGQFAYQTVQGSNVIRVPAFMGNLTIYFTQPLFKGAAVIQPGLNFFYNTSYAADSYMPATRMFFLQDQREIGNYLYMDIFLNVKIQRVRLYVTYSHFNATFMGNNYYMTPNYPMPDAAFKFGLSWRFHD